ncbi:hypothetical protein LI328DRAFT_130088 [Trichoderma asperelloides]|nr:hypothetical protein LI328DRAFT_130088 [Trichoderma asperelloides]
MPVAEQLQSVKELGLIFSYMNNQIVWDKFCHTYEALYDRFGDFDKWYTQNGGPLAIPSLQNEWQAYMRAMLDSIVTNSRTEFDKLYTLRRIPLTNPARAMSEAFWTVNKLQNRRLIKLDKRCRHLP